MIYWLLYLYSRTGIVFRAGFIGNSLFDLLHFFLHWFLFAYYVCLLHLNFQVGNWFLPLDDDYVFLYDDIMLIFCNPFQFHRILIFFLINWFDLLDFEVRNRFLALDEVNVVMYDDIMFIGHLIDTSVCNRFQFDRKCN